MFLLRFLLVLVVLVGTPGIVQAQTRPIEGAFGVRLGQVVEQFKQERDVPYPVSDLTPKVPFKPFSKYTAVLTPVTHQVLSIEAEGPLLSDAEHAAVVAALESTYGKGVVSGGWWKLERQGRSIVLFEPHEGGKTLLIFNDDKLGKLGEAEQKTKAVHDADPRGLTP